MPVYLIADIQIHDSQHYAQYTDQAQGIAVQQGGRYLVRGGSVTPLSGNWRPQRVVIIAFDTMEQLPACFASPGYRAIAQRREASITSRSIIVEGYIPDATLLF